MKINNNALTGELIAHVLRNHNVVGVKWLQTDNLHTSAVRIDIRHGNSGVASVVFDYQLRLGAFSMGAPVRASHLDRLRDVLYTAEAIRRGAGLE